MPQASGQVVTLSFFRFRIRYLRWAMSQMWLVRRAVRRLPGVQFFKLVGTAGGSGYGSLPDLRTYGLLIVWRDDEASRVWRASPVFEQFRRRALEEFTIQMRPLRSRGSWSGFSGLECLGGERRSDLLCVLTRATIRPSFLWRFWRRVKGIARRHELSDGLLFTKGLAEVPVIEQATFSVWSDEASMRAFASTSEHAEAIAETRRLGGFREEMFTHFEPIGSAGTWGGENPLAGRVGAVGV